MANDHIHYFRWLRNQIRLVGDPNSFSPGNRVWGDIFYCSFCLEIRWVPSENPEAQQ